MLITNVQKKFMFNRTKRKKIRKQQKAVNKCQMLQKGWSTDTRNTGSHKGNKEQTSGSDRVNYFNIMCSLSTAAYFSVYGCRLQLWSPKLALLKDQKLLSHGLIKKTWKHFVLSADQSVINCIDWTGILVFLFQHPNEHKHRLSSFLLHFKLRAKTFIQFFLHPKKTS